MYPQVIEAKTPHAVVGVEGEDARVDARYALSILSVRFSDFSCRMLKDDRVKQIHKQSVFMTEDDDFVDRIG